jgi:hypothetical protein
LKCCLSTSTKRLYLKLYSGYATLSKYKNKSECKRPEKVNNIIKCVASFGSFAAHIFLFWKLSSNYTRLLVIVYIFWKCLLCPRFSTESMYHDVHHLFGFCFVGCYAFLNKFLINLSCRVTCSFDFFVPFRCAILQRSTHTLRDVLFQEIYISLCALLLNAKVKAITECFC